MQNNTGKPCGGFFKQGFVLLLILSAVYLAEGLQGLAPLAVRRE